MFEAHKISEPLETADNATLDAEVQGLLSQDAIKNLNIDLAVASPVDKVLVKRTLE